MNLPLPSPFLSADPHSLPQSWALGELNVIPNLFGLHGLAPLILLRCDYLMVSINNNNNNSWHLLKSIVNHTRCTCKQLTLTLNSENLFYRRGDWSIERLIFCPKSYCWQAAEPIFQSRQFDSRDIYVTECFRGCWDKEVKDRLSVPWDLTI